ncbi:uncharacterized protein LOC129969704 [Argiope bruennichi]|uniref:MD-2-related lipid-recognition domain-containing protein n=1 Tax=Argiope bruennichi TaxID=94029 RepID=A0A8T0FP06_ARGBR|nr:uncharacterized protein LOC129969704 [Argiope bruennichi]KAF8792811.1 hypothetical protein HNY73_004366 [Argiope bruennichi]
MKTLFFACFCLIICSYVQAIDYVKCGSGKQILNLKELRINPDPIRLSGKNALISIDAALNEEIPAGAKIHIKAWKVKKIFAWDIYLKAPCLLAIGCDVEHCKFFKYFSGENMCPVKPQSFRGEAIEIEMPELGSFVKWFASGRFWIEVQIIGRNSEQLSCYSIKGEAKALFAPLKPNSMSQKIEKQISE